MASELTKAVKAWAVLDSAGNLVTACTSESGAEARLKDFPGRTMRAAILVPAAEYERLTKVDNLAAQLMEHEACVSECDKCKERRKISDKLARVVSVRRKARNAK